MVDCCLTSKVNSGVVLQAGGGGGGFLCAVLHQELAQESSEASAQAEVVAQDLHWKLHKQLHRDLLRDLQRGLHNSLHACISKTCLCSCIGGSKEAVLLQAQADDLSGVMQTKADLDDSCFSQDPEVHTAYVR